MEGRKHYLILLLIVSLSLALAGTAGAHVDFQCPTQPGGSVTGDLNGDGMLRASDGEINLPLSPNQVCMHLTAGDGFSVMADGTPMYMFGFHNVTGLPDNEVMNAGMLAQEWPAPTIQLNEGEELYLTLTNVGMVIRPDLFDPHTVHYHGFPQSSNIFDGLPESAIAIGMGASLTYYYLNNHPGTYMYHCHVEATEHMQMGMLGNLYVRPAQNGTPILYNGRTYTTFVYNDGDGSTGYDVEYPLQLGGFDRTFHDASWNVQPLPFANMRDVYPMINGRGYPDTVNTGPMPQPLDPDTLEDLNGSAESQPVHSFVEANQGQRILLRVSNLNVTRLHTLASPSIPMLIVGKDAKHLRSSVTGENLYYLASSITLGGGESFDVILDTNGLDGIQGTADDVPAGTYFLYTTNLNLLSNDQEDFGGMMTEIRIY
ncbi:MAG: hypothetical protein Kow0025_22980 [Thermodesulfovibrionales bacterium]